MPWTHRETATLAPGETRTFAYQMPDGHYTARLAWPRVVKSGEDAACEFEVDGSPMDRETRIYAEIGVDIKWDRSVVARITNDTAEPQAVRILWRAQTEEEVVWGLMSIAEALSVAAERIRNGGDRPCP